MNSAEIQSFNVWTGIRLHREKSKSHRSPEIITWESCPSPENYYMADTPVSIMKSAQMGQLAIDQRGSLRQGNRDQPARDKGMGTASARHANSDSQLATRNWNWCARARVTALASARLWIVIG